MVLPMHKEMGVWLKSVICAAEMLSESLQGNRFPYNPLERQPWATLKATSALYASKHVLYEGKIWNKWRHERNRMTQANSRELGDRHPSERTQNPHFNIGIFFFLNQLRNSKIKFFAMNEKQVLKFECYWSESSVFEFSEVMCLVRKPPWE